MAKQANSLTPRLELRVVGLDGTEHDYVTAPVDYWRAEQVVRSVFTAEGGVTLGGIQALAYSCAVRGGHAYKTRRASTDEKALFATWIEQVADVAVLSDDGEDQDPKAGGDDPGSPGE